MAAGYSNRTREDLIEIFDYLEAENTAAARRIIGALDDTLRDIEAFPLAAPRQRFVEDEDLAEVRFRALPGFRMYLVFYVWRDDRPFVLRNLLGARDMPALLDDEDVT